jgi:phosphoenolpyruvate carboxykinase (ATP)
MNIEHTRNMVRAAINGDLDDAQTVVDPIFGLTVPTEVPGVPAEVLIPRDTWADAAEYDVMAHRLAHMFHENFRAYADGVSEAIRSAGPTDLDPEADVPLSGPGEG